jgi:uncharacterized protein (DUF433 family)
MISQQQRELDARYGIVRKRGRCGGRPTVGESRLNATAVLSFVIAAGNAAARMAYPYLKAQQIRDVVSWALQTPERWR